MKTLLQLLCIGLCYAGCLYTEPVESFSVQLRDPLHPDMESIEYGVNMRRDGHGVPQAYWMPLFASTCYNGKCKPLEVVLYWDALGRFLNVYPVPGKPLSKTDHIVFSEADYAQLDMILKDRNSKLGSYLIQLHGAEEDRTVDGVSGATTPYLHGAVVPGAVYSSWVLWHWVNGEVVGQLLETTRRAMSKDDVVRFMTSDDQAQIRFALEMAGQAGVEDDTVYRVFEKADRDNAKRALQVLNGRFTNPEELDLRLVKMLGRTSEAAEWAILDFLGTRESHDPQVNKALESSIPKLTFIGRRKAQLILKRKSAG